MYISKDLAFTPRTDLTTNIDSIESICVEILLPKTRPILTGVCHRPPKQMEFYDLLEKLCDNGNRQLVLWNMKLLYWVTLIQMFKTYQMLVPS